MRPIHDSPHVYTSSKKLCLLLVGLLSLALHHGCDTGFGQSCKLPEGDIIQEVCSAPQVQEGDNTSTMQSANATCALDNFPGCDTFLCLKYRGGNPYCSMRCTTSADCGDGVCCPLVGDCRGNTGGAAQMSVDPSMAPQAAMSQDACANGTDDCYCIRKGDL